MSTSSATEDFHFMEVLHECEDILLSLIKSDGTKLSKMLFKKCIISDENWKLFNSLDHSRIDQELQIRYLLRSVTSKIKEDESAWGKFLSILANMGEKQICEILRTKMTATDIGFGSGDITLSVEDANVLVELLVEVSDTVYPQIHHALK